MLHMCFRPYFIASTLAVVITVFSDSGAHIISQRSVAKCEATKSHRSNETNRILNLGDVKESYRLMDFALRGVLYRRTNDLAVELSGNGDAAASKKPFSKIIRANIVDPQALGQEPITYLRQVLAAVTLPSLWKLLPADVVSKAKTILAESGSMGQMSNATGLTVVKKSVAAFISKRDGFPADFNDIILTDGVAGAVEIVLKLLQPECNEPDVGVMVPIPIYPLYNALLTQHGLKQINYYLSPANNFELELTELQRAYDDALCSCNCKPRALVLINPGNPSGRVLSKAVIEEIIKFAHRNNLLLLADEIYQFNLHRDVPFFSVHKLIREMPFPYNTTEAISFLSISKGFTGEAGLRGGYAHLLNMDFIAHHVLNKLMMVKECSNLEGQVGLFSLTSPPALGDPSYDLYEKEKNDTLSTYKEIVHTWFDEFNKIEGINCSVIEGGPVAFPRITVPDKAIMLAASKGFEPDVFYAMELLESRGLSVSAGSSFGMPHGQHFLRISLPANKAVGDEIAKELKIFNAEFLKKYS